VEWDRDWLWRLVAPITAGVWWLMRRGASPQSTGILRRFLNILGAYYDLTMVMRAAGINPFHPDAVAQTLDQIAAWRSRPPCLDDSPPGDGASSATPSSLPITPASGSNAGRPPIPPL